ncbi:MAG: hypothetical protein KA479_01130 [Saprospiraceae bacterium]|jgi:hypothetical protein|nr:hypothetical protein [Saprospiraceae bacterium]
MLKWILLFLWVSVFSTQGNAQVLSPAIPDPASQGIGGITLPAKTYFQPLGNPAVLSTSEGFGGGLYTIQPFGLTELSGTYLYGWRNTRSGGIGGGLSYSGFGNIRQYGLYTAFGQRLWNRLDVGITLEGQFLNFADYGQHSRFGFSVGAKSALRKGLTLGILARNPVGFSSSKDIRLPSALVATLMYEVSSQVEMAAEWVQEEQQPADIRLGIAYKPLPYLPLRIGYQALSSSFYVGVGYSLKSRWQIAFASGYHPYLGFSPSVGLIYLFNIKS